jgi:hypothetical protein
MITTFEVGAVFKLVNEASPALAAILKEVRALNTSITKAKDGLASLGLSMSSIKLGTAVGETGALAKAWGDVAANAALARTAIGQATRASARGAAVASGGVAGGGRGRLGSWLGGGGGGHISTPNIPLGGGAHYSGSGPAMGVAALVGIGMYDAAVMEKGAWWMTYHAHQEQNETNHERYRKVIGDAMIASGYDMKEVTEAATDELRMFQATPTGGMASLPTMLGIAAKEAMSKGNTLKESMASFVGLAHMTGSYTDTDLEKLAPAFAALSTADPRSLKSMTTAAGYAVPLLHSALEINPLTTLALGTALAGAGALNSKSGTWTREMVTRAMPGTSLMSRMAFKKHEAGLKRLGLVDENDQPTWFTDGRPDPLKMLKIGGDHLATIPLKERMGLEKAAFGTQGSEGFAMLSNKPVLDRVDALVKMMSDPALKNHYDSLLPDLQNGSTAQNARTAIQEFNVTMAELGRMTLPMANVVLNDFKSVLEGIRKVLPGGDGKSMATIGGHAIFAAVPGLAAGGIIGAAGGPVGMLGGALTGAVVGGVHGVAQNYVDNNPGKRGPPGGSFEQNAESAIGWLVEAAKGTVSKLSAMAPAHMPQISLSLNLDGRTLATAISSSENGAFNTQAPAFDGSGKYTGGDAQHTDK